jgi:hypothetical protein
MSSAPSGGVAIEFTPGRSAVDAYLAELRRGVTIPLNFTPASSGYTGPSGAPTGAPTGITGPSTFSNPAGGAFNWTSNSAANYVGPGGASPMAGAGGAQLGQSATQLSTAAAALTQAAQAMSAAASRGGDIGGGGGLSPRSRSSNADRVERSWDAAALAQFKADERATASGARAKSANAARVDRAWEDAAFAQFKAEERAAADTEQPESGSGGGTAGSRRGRGNQFLGMSAGRLARVASWGFIATEAAQMYSADRAYGREYRGAAGNEEERAKLTAQRYTALQESAFGLGYIVSGVKSYITGEDNSPEGVQATLGDAEAQDKYGALKRSDYMTGRELSAAGRVGDASPGFSRRQAEINESWHATNEKLKERETARIDAAEAIRQRSIDRANDAYDADVKKGFNKSYVGGIRDADVAGANADFAAAKAAIGREFAPLRSSATHIAYNASVENQRNFNAGVIESDARGQAGTLAAQGYTYAARRTEIQGDLAAQNSLPKAEVERQQDQTNANYKQQALDAATSRQFNFQFGAGGQSDLSTQSISAHLSRDPTLAAHLSNQQARQSALFGLDALPETLYGQPVRRQAQDSVNRNFDQRDKLIDQDRDDRLSTQGLNIDADTGRLRILNGREGTPYSRGIASQAYGIAARTELDMRSSLLQDPGDKSGNAASFKARGIEQERRLAQETFDHITTSEVDPMRTALNGPGTADIGQAVKNMEQYMQQLRDLPVKADGILQALLKLIGSGSQ